MGSFSLPQPRPKVRQPATLSGSVLTFTTALLAMLMGTLLLSGVFHVNTGLAQSSKPHLWVMRLLDFTFVFWAILETLAPCLAIWSYVGAVMALFLRFSSRLWSSGRLRLLVILLYLVSSAFAIRMPIRQVDIPGKTHLIDVDHPFSFINTVKYCHMYPDIMCYERPGNGDTPGDEMFWSTSTCTDASGLGAIEIRFPPVRDRENLDNSGNADRNGLWHPRNDGRFIGISVLLFAGVPSVRFYPGDTSFYRENVPRVRLRQNLYVEFSGPSMECFDFVFRRDVLWSGFPVPPETVPRPQVPVHDDL